MKKNTKMPTIMNSSTPIMPRPPKSAAGPALLPPPIIEPPIPINWKSTEAMMKGAAPTA